MSVGATGLKSTDKHQIIQECCSYNQLTLTIEKKRDWAIQIGPEDYTLSKPIWLPWLLLLGFSSLL